MINSRWSIEETAVTQRNINFYFLFKQVRPLLLSSSWPVWTAAPTPGSTWRLVTVWWTEFDAGCFIIRRHPITSWMDSPIKQPQKAVYDERSYIAKNKYNLCNYDKRLYAHAGSSYMYKQTETLCDLLYKAHHLIFVYRFIVSCLVTGRCTLLAALFYLQVDNLSHVSADDCTLNCRFSVNIWSKYELKT
jgi:hypothetical protein